MKNILILQGNPNKNSLIAAAAQSYYQGALKNSEKVEIIHLVDLKFDPILRNGYKSTTPLEADLVDIQEKIKAADHLTLFYPTWWGTMPALMKGFIDRVFLPKFAFVYKENDRLPKKLLRGRSARVVTSMDAPWIWYKITGSPGFKAIKNSILGFSGFKPIKISTLYTTKNKSEEERKNWLAKINQYGQLDAR